MSICAYACTNKHTCCCGAGRCLRNLHRATAPVATRLLGRCFWGPRTSAQRPMRLGKRSPVQLLESSGHIAATPQYAAMPLSSPVACIQSTALTWPLHVALFLSSKDKKDCAGCCNSSSGEHSTVAAYIRHAQAWPPSYLRRMLILPVHVMHDSMKLHDYACPPI
jgi:hypothetical protein